MAAAAVLLATTSAHGTANRSRAVLLPLTRAQVVEAGASGTGCSWLSSRRAVLFSAADDHAVVRIGTGVVRLRPASDASDLFPFTFDRWTGKGLSVVVDPRGRSVRKGGELLERPAALSVKVRGIAVKLGGLLNCGS